MYGVVQTTRITHVCFIWVRLHDWVFAAGVSDVTGVEGCTQEGTVHETVRVFSSQVTTHGRRPCCLVIVLDFRMVECVRLGLGLFAVDLAFSLRVRVY